MDGDGEGIGNSSNLPEVIVELPDYPLDSMRSHDGATGRAMLERDSVSGSTFDNRAAALDQLQQMKSSVISSGS